MPPKLPPQKEDAMARPLFAVTEDFATVDKLLDRLDESEADRDTRERIEADIMAWVQSLNDEQREKIDAYGWIIKRLDAEGETAREVAAEFQKKAQAREGRVKYLKGIMLEHMQQTEQPVMAGRVFTMKITPNGGEQPLQVSPDVLPEEYFYAPDPLPDNKKIREALVAGAEVPGALLKDRGVHLRIR